MGPSYLNKLLHSLDIRKKAPRRVLLIKVCSLVPYRTLAYARSTTRQLAILPCTAHVWHPHIMPKSLAALLVCTTAFAPQSIRTRTLPALKAVDYEAELWRSGSLNTPDAELNEWCEKWARRAIIGEGAGGASVKLTTPVKLARRESGARLLFTKSGSGYADKDKAKDDKWKDDDDDKPAPPKAGTGGVDVSADGGAIVATRCAYEGSGIVKQMSEEKIVTQLRKDVSAAFG